MKVLHVIARMNVGGTARYVGRLVESDPSAILATGYVQGAEAEDPCVSSLTVRRVSRMGRSINPVADHFAFRSLRKIIRDEKPYIQGGISRSISGWKFCQGSYIPWPSL